MCCSVLQYVAVCCSALQCVTYVAVCCIVLQCVAVSCSVIHTKQCDTSCSSKRSRFSSVRVANCRCMCWCCACISYTRSARTHSLCTHSSTSLSSSSREACHQEHQRIRCAWSGRELDTHAYVCVHTRVGARACACMCVRAHARSYHKDEEGGGSG